jgi:hypothetical protein
MIIADGGRVDGPSHRCAKAAVVTLVFAPYANGTAVVYPNCYMSVPAIFKVFRNNHQRDNQLASG